MIRSSDISSILKNHNLEITENLGNCLYGFSYVANNTKLKQQHVVKYFKFDSRSYLLYLNMHRNLKQIRDIGKKETLITYYNSFYENGIYYVEMDYCYDDILRQYLSQIGSPGLGEEKIQQFLSHIILGLYELHKANIVHQDLRLENIFLFDNSCKAKIGSFCPNRLIGNIRRDNRFFYKKEIYLTSTIRGHYYKLTKLDNIWSLGLIIYELCFGKILFNYNNMKNFINQNEIDLKFKRYKYSNELKELLLSCLQIQEIDRKPIHQIIYLDFIYTNSLIQANIPPKQTQSLRVSNVKTNKNTKRRKLNKINENKLPFKWNIDINSNYFTQSLCFDFCFLDNRQIYLLSNYYDLCGIKTFTIRNNSIESESARHIGDSFTHMTSLTELNLSNDYLGGSARQISRHFSKLICLQKLDLSDNNLGTTGITHVGHNIRNLYTLRFLDLSNNTIKTHLDYLSSSFFALQKLVSLNISSNEFDNLSIISLAQNFHYLVSLEQLYLSQCWLDDARLKLISNRLVDLPCIKMLFIDCNFITQQGFDNSINDILRVKTLNYLLLYPTLQVHHGAIIQSYTPFQFNVDNVGDITLVII